MALPKGYREILAPCPLCQRKVAFATWDGAKHLPMRVRCVCGRVMTHDEARIAEQDPRAVDGKGTTR